VLDHYQDLEVLANLQSSFFQHLGSDVVEAEAEAEVEVGLLGDL
jgi:hypothetical protein